MTLMEAGSPLRKGVYGKGVGFMRKVCVHVMLRGLVLLR